MSLLRDLDWDSRFFSRRIARVERERLSAAELADIERERLARSIDCLYFLAAPDDPETIVRVAAVGWRFVDVRTTFSVSLDGALRTRTAGSGLREAVGADRAELAALAAQSHVDSRFYKDGRFPRPLCDRLFAEWLERCLDGELADAVLVAGSPGAPRGYVTLRAPRGDQPAGIGLFAVAPAARGQGLGGELLDGAIAWAQARGEPVLQVVTQGSNTRAVRAYERAGFTTLRVAYWYHAWR